MVDPGEVPDLKEKDMLTEDIKKFVGKKIKIRGYIRPSFKLKNLKDTGAC